MSADLVPWLLEQIAADERIARSNKHDGGEPATKIEFDYSDHTVCVPRATFLAECDAKRRIIEAHGNVNAGDCETCVRGQWGYPTNGGSLPQRHPCETLRLLALPYIDRPGYLEEWRP